jgi:hypothetical protein
MGCVGSNPQQYAVVAEAKQGATQFESREGHSPKRKLQQESHSPKRKLAKPERKLTKLYHACKASLVETIKDRGMQACEQTTPCGRCVYLTRNYDIAKQAALKLRDEQNWTWEGAVVTLEVDVDILMNCSDIDTATRMEYFVTDLMSCDVLRIERVKRKMIW